MLERLSVHPLLTGVTRHLEANLIRLSCARKVRRNRNLTGMGQVRGTEWK